MGNYSAFEFWKPGQIETLEDTQEKIKLKLMYPVRFCVKMT